MTGVILLYYLQVFSTTEIVLGSIIGTLMMLNVWGIIWRNQKIVIGLKEGDAVIAGAKAALASRTNTLFSLPMLYFMISSAHSPIKSYFMGTPATGTDPGYLGLDFLIICLLIALIEFNAIYGKMYSVIASVRGVITSSLVLTVVFSGLVFYI